MTLEEERKREHEKYRVSYTSKHYSMGARRKQDAMNDLAALPVRGTYLDVSCGRGEMIEYAKNIGFDLAIGTEIVDSLIDGVNVHYAEVHKLPFSDDSFNVVSMFDVIEHLIPGDDELACRELLRVAKHFILITANNRPSIDHGVELHINKRPYDEWNELFTNWFDGCEVERIGGRRNYVSPAWRVTLL